MQSEKNFKKKYLEERLKYSIKKDDNKYVFIFVGIPGCGKTTLGLLMENYDNAIYLDQDMFSEYGKKSSKKYHEAISYCIMEGKCNLLYLGKCHHDSRTRNAVLSTIPPDFNIIFIEFYHKRGLDAMISFCEKRIEKREKHPTLKNNDSRKTKKVLNFFKKNFESVSEKESDEKNIIKLNVSDTVTEWIEKILPYIKNLPSKIENFPEIDGKIIVDKFKENSEMQKDTNFKNWNGLIYYSIGFNNNEMEKILQNNLVKEKLKKFKGLRLQQNFHLTTKYFGSNKYKSGQQFYQNLIGKETKVICLGIFADEKGICVLCTGDFACANKYAHITLGNDNKTKPFYSNTLCENGIFHKFKENIIISGKHQ